MHKTGLWRFSIDGFFLSRRFWWLLYFGCFILFLAGLVCILGFSVLGFGLLILVFFGFLGGLFGLHKAGAGFATWWFSLFELFFLRWVVDCVDFAFWLCGLEVVDSGVLGLIVWWFGFYCDVCYYKTGFGRVWRFMWVLLWL